ncbi:MAG: hypothetical protein ACK4YQ_09895 [Phenylobacterium sp.]|uniref:hypothetical protein n=1 Tax=Phenylobacterium sp. TaxID=1871053 RepID=UPI00391AB640
MKIALATLCILFAAAGAAHAQEAPARGHSKTEFLKTYDSNLDGAVDGEEYAAVRRGDFDRTDANKDGALTDAEYVAEYTTRLDAQLAEMRERQIKQAHVRFGVMDADKSARMTREEYEATAKRTFSRLDTNGDGRVDDKDTADRH